MLILFAKIRVQGFKQKESRWSLVYSFTRGVAMAYEDIYKGLTEEEKQIINAYRNATSAEQEIIKKILDIKTEQEKLSNSKIG